MKKILTKEERKKWQRILTKYFQQVNKTGGSHLPYNTIQKIEEWYKMYMASEELKKSIVEEN